MLVASILALLVFHMEHLEVACAVSGVACEQARAFAQASKVGKKDARVRARTPFLDFPQAGVSAR